jgi:hypothetical protein
VLSMVSFLKVLCVVLVAVGMALSLAHALELPGKLKLNNDAYLSVQSIYYPGFTIGGIFGEPGAILATLALLFITPFPSAAFWLVSVAFVSLLVMHGVFWVFVQPVNKVWIKEQRLQGASAAFFAMGSNEVAGAAADQNWTTLRNRWEYAHLVRAVLGMLALIALMAGLTIAS